MAVTRAFICFGVFFWASALSGCGSPVLEELGHPFQNNHVRIHWAATNAIPASLKVFKVSPARWSLHFLSNLVVLCAFDRSSEVLKALAPALKGFDATYIDDSPRGSRKSIVLNPSRGRVFYHSEGAVALPKQQIVGVPAEKEALASALDVLSRLGFSTNELQRRPQTGEFHFTREARTQWSYGNPEKKVIARGLYLLRTVDGYGIDGIGTCGGLFVRFGNQGKIAELELAWPTIASPRSAPTAGTNQIYSWIRQGKATIATDHEPPRITSLTITNAAIWYFGSKTLPARRTMYPFLSFGAVAEIGQQKVPVRVNCPVLRE